MGTHRGWLWLGALLLAGCTEACPSPGTDGGSSGGGGRDASASGGQGDGGRTDGGRTDGGSADSGPSCGPDTPRFGEACGDCGARACNRNGQLECMDPGFNACGVCGQLDNSGGIVGRTCGSCGVVGCADGGLITECQGEHPPNDCGGCGTIPAFKGAPDAGCSGCMTGVWSCSADQNDLWCVGGRATNACGSCGRCITHHADLEDLSNGVFFLAGTRVIIEDVGRDVAMGTLPPPAPPVDAGRADGGGVAVDAGRADGGVVVDAGTPDAGDPLAGLGTKVLSFEPLLSGPAGLSLESAIIYLSPSTSQADPGAFSLTPFFSLQGGGTVADPLRQYNIYPMLDAQLANQNYVLVFDGFLGQVVARGRLNAGPPP